MLNHAKQLGDIVRKARTEQKLTQAKVAELADVNPRTIHNIEHYKGNPKIDLLVPLIRSLNIDPNEIFYPENRCESSTIRRVCKKIEECSEQEVRELEPVIDALIQAFKEKGKNN
jgi:DNA-binding XRE family transcriptional regulator